MKNLKRVLSLGLASVMLLGMMVVGASAKDFTDAEKITHSEAVETMVALGIIKGKEDGSFFDPEGTVTRAEMAKMIAVAMNGGNEAATGVKTVPSFTDIGTHWAQAQIEYCYDMGIINGRGDGTFDPDGLVTGTEAAKMVLTALGYDSKAFELEGAAWATHTNELAKTTRGCKLTDELDTVVMSQPATRDTAAQMIWNGLQAYVVTIDPEQNKTGGEITWGYNTKGTTTLLKQRYDADVAVGIFEGNWNTGAASDKGNIVVTEKVLNDSNVLVDGTSHIFPYDLDIDNIGEEVKVVWKDGAKGIKGQADSKDKIFGVFNTGATRVVRSQLSKVKDGKAGENYLNIDGTKYKANPEITVITNYIGNGTDYKAAGTKDDAAVDSKYPVAKVLKVNSGYPIKVTFDDKNLVDTVYVTESYLAVVASTNATKISLVGNVSYNLTVADHEVEEGLEKGDIVAVTPLYNGTPSNEKSQFIVKKADKVSGELVSGKINETLNLDSGKSYKINYQNAGATKYNLLTDGVSIPGNDGKIVDSFPFSNNDYIGEDFDLYLVNGYVMAAIQTSKSASNYSLVTEVKGSAEAGATFGGLQLQVLTADGTKEIITVSKDSKDKTQDPETAAKKAEDYTVGDIITYTFNKDDQAVVNIVARAIVKANQTELEYDEKAKTLDEVPTSADCVFFAQTKSGVDVDGSRADTDASNKLTAAEWKAYNIRELDGDDFNVVSKVVKNGKVVAVVVNDCKTPRGATDNTVYAIISSYNYKEKDYWVFTAQANGEEYTLKVKTSPLGKDTDKAKDAAGMLVKFNPTADEVYTYDPSGTKDVTILKTNGSVVEGDDKWYTGYVKESSASDRTVTFWDAATPNDGNQFLSTTPVKTYAIDKDAQIIFVDLDGKKSEAEGTISAYTGIEGKYKNAGFVLNDKKVIQALFIETSGKKAVQ